MGGQPVIGNSVKWRHARRSDLSVGQPVRLLNTMIEGTISEIGRAHSGAAVITVALDDGTSTTTRLAKLRIPEPHPTKRSPSQYRIMFHHDIWHVEDWDGNPLGRIESFRVGMRRLWRAFDADGIEICDRADDEWGWTTGTAAADAVWTNHVNRPVPAGADQ